MSPTQRSLAFWRDLGATVQVVEKWNPHAKKRQDLFGCIDILVLHNGQIIGVQACADASRAARVAKSIAEPRLVTWLRAGALFFVESWGKHGPRGKRKVWTRHATPLGLTDNRSFAVALKEAEWKQRFDALLRRDAQAKEAT